MIEIASVIGEISLEDVEPAIAVIISDADAHSGLFVAVFAIGASCHHGDIRERAVMIVAKENARFRIHRDINIRPAVVIKIRAGCGDGVSGTRFKNAGFL